MILTINTRNGWHWIWIAALALNCCFGIELLLWHWIWIADSSLWRKKFFARDVFLGNDLI
jgi:hypothetical protein